MKPSTLAASRSARSIVGANYTGAIPLPAAMASHPSTSAAPTETYPSPADAGGWHYVIEPADGAWIAFVDVAGKALLWTKRDADGGVLGAPYIFQRPDLAISGAIAASRKVSPRKVTLQYARAVVASAVGEAPEAARLWKAGWNRTDKGDLNFTPRSAELVMAAYEKRGNPLAFYYEHEDRIPLAERGGSPMKGVCSAPSSALTVRDSPEGPESWAESIAWTPEAKRQIATGERRQISPIAAFNSDTREIVEILNVSLCAEGATHFGTILASAGKVTSMDQLIQSLLDAVNAGDFEAAENVIAQMEATEGGAATAAMAKGMMAKMSKAEPAAPPPPPAPADTATKTLAASRMNDEFSRGMADLRAATDEARAAAQSSRKATVLTLITSRRDLFDATDEREHLTTADPIATERHIRSLERKAKTGLLAASKGADPAKVVTPPGPPVVADATFGLSDVEQAVAKQEGITFEQFSKSKGALKNRGVNA